MPIRSKLLDGFGAYLHRAYPDKANAIYLMWIGVIQRLKESGYTSAWTDTEVDAIKAKLAPTQVFYLADALKAYRAFSVEASIPVASLDEHASIEIPAHLKSFVQAASDLVRIAQVSLAEAQEIDASYFAALADTNNEVLRVFLTNPLDGSDRIRHITQRLEPHLHACALDAITYSAALIPERIVTKVFPDTIWPYCREVEFRSPAEVGKKLVISRRKLEEKYFNLPLDTKSEYLRNVFMKTKKGELV